MVCQFAENNGAGFNEVYHTQGSSPTNALNGYGVFVSARLALLHPLNTFLRIRVSDINSPRLTSLANVNLSGLAPSTGGPLPVGAACVCSIRGSAMGARKLWLRGIPEAWYLRNVTTGVDAPPAALLTALANYLAAMVGFGVGMVHLQPKGVGLYTNQPLTKVDGSLGNGITSITAQNNPVFALGSRVVIGGTSRKDLPALNGQWTVVGVYSTGFQISYNTPQGIIVLNPKGYVRQATYSSLDVFASSQFIFDHFGTRTSRNPLTNSRGARRAQRLRLSL
jgi:hypothetical protein